MLDYDLARLYEVETRKLKQAVRRNPDRFPSDFMFELTEQEIDEMVSHFVTPSKSHFGGSLPFAFTEQGVAMLLSVLRTDKAVAMSLQIMRTFVLMRKYAMSHKELSDQVRELENRYDQQFGDIHEAINYLLRKELRSEEQHERRPIGFKAGTEGAANQTGS